MKLKQTFLFQFQAYRLLLTTNIPYNNIINYRIYLIILYNNTYNTSVLNKPVTGSFIIKSISV